MLPLALILTATHFQEPDRTPSIYRCTTAEAEDKRFPELVEDDGYTEICIEPKPGPKATLIAKGKVKFIKPGLIDTKPNRRWRDATIAFALGKISPKIWLSRTKGLRETVHYLSSPTTPELYKETGGESAVATLAEMFVLSLPGKPCFTSGDTWGTRWLPEAGKLQSWILAMNDRLGPMLHYRAECPFIVNGKLEVIRADAKPGLFVFRQKSKTKSLTFYFNNSKNEMPIAKLNLDKVTLSRGLIANDDASISLMRTGSFIVEE